ncbi:MAG: DUF2851 family protein [Bacteroidales bacterium]|nr:MAG: DUF2851 family protein [Bacteroidales bacterium]
MKEDFLHHIWKFGLFEKRNLNTDTGEKVRIMDPGEHNTDAGPDFFNARIMVGETLWVGNVEVHINSSDWLRHGHNSDKAYDNVILQVVFNHDMEIFRTSGQTIPTIQIEFKEEIYRNYLHLTGNKEWIPCESLLFKVDPFYIKHWLYKVMVDRLELKSKGIISKLEKNKNDWDETFYQHLARNFGFKKNAEPFELLAKCLPYKYLARHKNQLSQLEAMLFGQAGLLEDLISTDEYYLSLQKEYGFFREKFSLKPLGSHLWKFLRLRPSNFPTVRIAQFSMLIHKSGRLFSAIIHSRDIGSMRKLFSVSASPYWNDHYVFHRHSPYRRKVIGKDAIDNLIINSVVPFFFAYGIVKNLPEFKERALDLLEKLPPEKNTIIFKWGKLGIKADNAFSSQALIQLKNSYCKPKKCLHCRIGSKILTIN